MTPAAAIYSSTTRCGPICARGPAAPGAARGLDAKNPARRYADVINEALKAKPADTAITTHGLPRQLPSHLISEGGYEPVAEILLGQLNYDGYS